MQFFLSLLWKNEALFDSHQVPSSAKWDGALLAKTKLARPRERCMWVAEMLMRVTHFSLLFLKP